MQPLMKNPKQVDECISAMMQAGAKELVVVADFDKTLTYRKNNGKPISSALSLLRDGKHLTPEYAKEAQALFDHYHPFEIDLSLPLKERIQCMEDWRNAHQQLLIKHGLKKSDLREIVQSKTLQVRQGVKEFLKILDQEKIPLLIFSASGCGEIIPLFFEAIEGNYANITYLTNHFQRDEEEKSIAPLKPLIHALNKAEVIKSTLH